MLFSSYTYKMKIKFIALFEHIATRSPHGIRISFFEYLLWLFGLDNMFFGSMKDAKDTKWSTSLEKMSS